MIGFFMMNLITATYVDEYRLAYLDHGFTQEPNWTIRERIRWLISWLPTKFLIMLNLEVKHEVVKN